MLFRNSFLSESSAPLRAAGIRCGPGTRRRDEGDAVHGAGRQAELAAGAVCGDHRVHESLRARDRVHRAGVDAARAADAARFVDQRDHGPFHSGWKGRPVSRARNWCVTLPCFAWMPVFRASEKAFEQISNTKGKTAFSSAKLAVRAAAAGMFGTQ